MPDSIPPPVFGQKLIDQFVEDLANRKIELDDSIRELAASILANGLLNPILCLQNGFVLAGHRRLFAGKFAGLNELPALIYPDSLTPTQRRTITTTENLQRLDLTPAQITQNCKELMDLNPDWTNTDLAKHLNKSSGTITKYLAPLKLPPEPFEDFMNGGFGHEEAHIISISPCPMETWKIKKGGGGRQEMRQSAKRSKKQPAEGAPPPDKFERLPIPFTDAVVVIKAKKGKEPLTLASTKQTLKDALDKVEKAIDQGYGLKTAIKAFSDTRHAVKTPRKRREKKS